MTDPATRLSRMAFCHMSKDPVALNDHSLRLFSLENRGGDEIDLSRIMPSRNPDAHLLGLPKELQNMIMSMAFKGGRPNNIHINNLWKHEWSPGSKPEWDVQHPPPNVHWHTPVPTSYPGFKNSPIEVTVPYRFKDLFCLQCVSPAVPTYLVGRCSPSFDPHQLPPQYPGSVPQPIQTVPDSLHHHT